MYFIQITSHYYKVNAYMNLLFESNITKIQKCDICDIVSSFERTFEEGLIHRDLHIGNVLKFHYKACFFLLFNELQSAGLHDPVNP